MKNYEIILILLLIIIIFFLFNRNDNICLRENFENDSYIFYQGYNSKDNLIECNLKDYEEDIDTLSKVCDNLSNCVGFTNKGILKNSNDLYKDPDFINENDGIYIKKDYNCNLEEIINSKSNILSSSTTSIPPSVMKKPEITPAKDITTMRPTMDTPTMRPTMDTPTIRPTMDTPTTMRPV
jgi:hypothetical protein